MKRILATLAVATMMVSVPTAAMAGGEKKNGNGGGAKQDHTCQGGHNCNVTIIEGDDDGDGKIEVGESFCQNKANGSYSLVNAQTIVCFGGVVVSVL